MSTKLRNLQGLRGVACLLVVLLHLAGFERGGQDFSAPIRYLGVFRLFGYAGVELFFIISGFIITWAHLGQLGNPRAAGPFLWKRFWRIYPTYWVCFLAAVLLAMGVQRWPFFFETKELVRWCLLLPQRTLNYYLPQAWTLVYEIVFYASFTVLFLLPRRWAFPLLGGWFLVTVCGSFAYREAGYLTRFFIGPMFADFLLGCFAALAIRKGIKAGGTACTLIGTFGFSLGGLLEYSGAIPVSGDFANRFLLFGIPSALVAYGLTVREQRGSWVLPNWLRAVGDASYSLYLTHGMVFQLVRFLTRGANHEPLPHPAWVMLTFGAALAVGLLCYRFVERPLLGLFRKPKVRAADVPKPYPITEPVEPGERRQAA